MITYKVNEPNLREYLHCNQIEVTYLENGNTYTQVVDTGWTHTFEHKKHSKIYLKVKPLCNLSQVVGLGFVNGGWYYQAIGTRDYPGEFTAKP